MQIFLHSNENKIQVFNSKILFLTGKKEIKIKAKLDSFDSIFFIALRVPKCYWSSMVLNISKYLNWVKSAWKLAVLGISYFIRAFHQRLITPPEKDPHSICHYDSKQIQHICDKKQNSKTSARKIRTVTASYKFNWSYLPKG